MRSFIKEKENENEKEISFSNSDQFIDNTSSVNSKNPLYTPYTGSTKVLCNPSIPTREDLLNLYKKVNPDNQMESEGLVEAAKLFQQFYAGVTKRTKDDDGKDMNETSLKEFTPKDKILLPIKTYLASQLHVLRPELEKISIQALDLTRKIFQKQSMLKTWTDFKGPKNERETNNPELENVDISTVLPPDFYVPKDFKLKEVGLRKCNHLEKEEHTKEKFLALQKKVHEAKVIFQKVGSDCVKETMLLSISLYRRNICQAIIDGFLPLSTYASCTFESTLVSK